ncbi:cysteine hydrolase family protein [Dactylosporangium sp. CA-092794]|uniref:cysteine hydrolase family protein n=1 Tax=Dactylosporangium sp. CA-092794 TaxID=3239929 RepID=UPI003D8B0670
MVTFDITPHRTALLIVDLQRLFVEGSPVAAPDGPAVLERLRRLAATCRQAGIRIIHTAHVVRPGGANAGVMGEVVPAVRAGLIDDGNPIAELHPGSEVHTGDVVLKKPRYGAFHGTDLELILRGAGIDTLIIGGIATHVCCDTTAREASVRDFRVLFLSDGTACFPLPDIGFGPVTADDLQRAVLGAIAFAFGEVLSTEEATRRIALSQTTRSSSALAPSGAGDAAGTG